MRAVWWLVELSVLQDTVDATGVLKGRVRRVDRERC